jgi:hypothetical protein
MAEAWLELAAKIDQNHLLVDALEAIGSQEVENLASDQTRVRA